MLRAADVIEDYSTGIVKVTFCQPRDCLPFQVPAETSVLRTGGVLSERPRTVCHRFVLRTKQPSGHPQPRFTDADWRAEVIYPASRTKVWGNLMSPLQTAAEDEGLGPLFSENRLAF
jgi:hypothetical protein